MSILKKFMAEKEGFEPSRPLSRPTPLAGEPLQPLEYFSMNELMKMAERVGFEPTWACTLTVFKTAPL